MVSGRSAATATKGDTMENPYLAEFVAAEYIRERHAQAAQDRKAGRARRNRGDRTRGTRAARRLVGRLA